MFSFRHRRQPNYGVYLLAYQLFNSSNIPPVTLVVILFQVAVFLGYIPMLSVKNTGAMCLLPSRILYHSEWLRMLTSIVMHADDMHLYFNMVSLLWKGRRLEPLFGSVRFLLLLIIFSLSTSAMTIALSLFADEVLQLDVGNLMDQCAIGFSGVLFALKVLHTTYFPYSDHYIFGWLPIPSRYACWAELILIQMSTPNASFVGHLAGIMVGLLYTVGPLEYVVDFLESIYSLSFGVSPWTYSETRRTRGTPYGSWFTQWGSGRVGVDPDIRRRYGRRQEPCDYDEFAGGMSEEEQILRATAESLRNHQPNAPPYPENDYANRWQ